MQRKNVDLPEPEGPTRQSTSPRLTSSEIDFNTWFEPYALETVSYTHLDVYKRQRQKTVDFVNFLNAGSMWAAPVGSTVNPDDACGLTIAAVSYTHLDVYKRQAMPWSAFAPAAK